MLDHISLHVSDYARSKEFYLKALKPFGYELLMSFEERKMAGLGAEGKMDFWIDENETSKTTHIAFHAKDRKTVDEFYKAALAVGGKDNGAPGLRPNYHKDYYVAFVLDPDGNNIEAVSHTEE